MSNKMIQEGWLRIEPELHDFVRKELCPGSGLSPVTFWAGLATLVDRYGEENAELLRRRDRLQSQVDDWLAEQYPATPGPDAQREFLTDIGYLAPDHGPVAIDNGEVDREIASLAGPQLVVPVDNARYALNAANARWGSLYDALYGTDVIPERDGAARGDIYNPARGARVVEFAAGFLDQALPLEHGSHRDVIAYRLKEKETGQQLRLQLADCSETALADASAFVGFRGAPEAPSAMLFRHHGLHIELKIDPRHPVGAAHPAGLRDVLMESALTTIQDCEDSVAAVDAEDKTRVYRNWLGLMRGDLETQFAKNGRAQTRRLAEDHEYRAPGGDTFTLPGRALQLVRNVGMHMYTDAVTTAAGEPIPEAFLDAMVTVLAGKRNIDGDSRLANSRCGSIYVVKPKLHGPEEVAFTDRLFGCVERMLGLQHGTVKLGIMDEERRTSVNLAECLRAAAGRVIFVNTGFLDRTGDEIHTAMKAGAVLPKNEIKSQPWMDAYERGNVDAALKAGLGGRGQIGKGMWAMPDEMSAMLAAKIEHPRAGASTAWVPSPTAATLHAMHYHQVDVAARQQFLQAEAGVDRDQLLRLPMLGDRRLGAEAIQRELENNAQGILGYVVRWVELGIGCSKVPDLHNHELMEDRATLRISSQHIANWLNAGLLTRNQVEKTFARMAALVDSQNRGVPGYQPMTAKLSASHGYQAALELVFAGRRQPNGYTEAILHRRRRAFKAALRAAAEVSKTPAVAGARA